MWTNKDREVTFPVWGGNQRHATMMLVPVVTHVFSKRHFLNVLTEDVRDTVGIDCHTMTLMRYVTRIYTLEAGALYLHTF